MNMITIKMMIMVNRGSTESDDDISRNVLIMM